jgi:lipopolysaccharide/colanic/teichoic acid biosynthesis glycosyltransferase
MGRRATDGSRIGVERRGSARTRGVGLPLRRFSRSTRALNVVLALVGIVLSAPLMFAVAVLVKLSSPGGVIYRQERVGIDRRSRGVDLHNSRRDRDKGGKLFTIYKFRTMRNDGSTSQVWAREGDPRITPIGAILRKYRLDELPQLFNVLLGDMNIVGPRPEQPEIFARLRDEVDRYPHRQQVPPGITGWAQVNQRYDETVEDVKKKVILDLEYLERRSPGEDLRILLRTVPVVLFRRGAR